MFTTSDVQRKKGVSQPKAGGTIELPPTPSSFEIRTEINGHAPQPRGIFFTLSSVRWRRLLPLDVVVCAACAVEIRDESTVGTVK